MKHISADIKRVIRTFNPSISQLRTLGIVLGCIFGALAYMTGSVLFVFLSVMLFFWTYVAPKLFIPILKALMVVTVPIGMFLSTMILILFFWGVILPVGVIGRMVKYDPLHMRRGVRKSAWEDVEANIHHTKMYP